MAIFTTNSDPNWYIQSKIKDLSIKLSDEARKNSLFSKILDKIDTPENKKKIFVVFVGFLYLISSLTMANKSNNPSIISPLVPSFKHSAKTEKNQGKYEVFGFAPYWNFSKLDNIDYSVLTTLAYFDIPVDASGNLVQGDGYNSFYSNRATGLFQDAHNNGTQVVLTITQMDNYTIESFLDSQYAQENTINQTVEIVKDRRIDGVNVDFEYQGNPGEIYRNQFSKFVENLTDQMHREIPESQVTVSVYASAVKDPKIYDIKSLSKNSDAIFMMAYDFANAGSESAMPTSPLYGHKEGKYWYDVASAVDDFLKYMPAEKLILGVPYYGYNYLVYEPTVKAQTLPYYSWRGSPKVETYSGIEENLASFDDSVSGWDDYGKVPWKAYFDGNSYVWRMIFMDDKRSLGLKYDFAKDKNLAGVGIWALGFDKGRNDLWKLLKDKFGQKDGKDVASQKTIDDNI